MLTLNILKKYKKWFILILIVGISFTVLLGKIYGFGGILFSLFFINTLLLIVYFKAINNLSSILDSSSYGKYISSFINKIAELYKEQTRDDCKRILVDYLMSGYFFIGDFDSLTLLFNHMKEKGWEEELSYQYFLTCYNLETRDLKSAEISIEKFESLFKKLDQKNPLYLDWSDKLLICKTIFNFYMDENFSDTIYLVSMYEKNENTLRKVRAGYYFAMCLLRKGQDKQAEELLCAVLDICPESIYANKAAETLSDLNSEFEYEFLNPKYTKANELIESGCGK